MRKADIKTGFLCNNDCLFCVQGDQKKILGNRSTDEVRAVLREAKKNCSGIVFTGGEVTVRADVVDLVAYARDLGFETIQIQSNGRMFMKESFCRDMIKAGANEFALALHGHTAALHDYLTQSQSFQQTVRGIRHLKQMGQRVLSNTVIVKPNYRHLPEIVKLLISLDVDQMQLAFVHALGAAAEHFDAMVPRKTLVKPYVIRSLTIARYFQKYLSIEAMPACFLSGFEEYLSEDIMPDITVFDHNYVVSDFTKFRLEEGKVKGPRCPECRYFDRCEGPWREYPEAFGWDEFVPVETQNGRPQ